jgi:hypothetical protein
MSLGGEEEDFGFEVRRPETEEGITTNIYYYGG